MIPRSSTQPPHAGPSASPPDTPVVGKIAYFYPPSKKNGTLPAVLRGRGVKGHEVFLRAMPHVLASIPDAKFVLVGRGWGPDGPAYEQTLRDLATTLGVDHAVLFTGETNDVPAMLAAFDVSVHCSLSDNLAGSVESLLMERPMVVSDIPGFADTIIHEETGLLVPMDDPPALAAAIVRLLRDRELARRLGQQGRARMLSRFTLARTVADVEALLSRLPDRASGHYRLTTTIARSFAAPFRLLPVAYRAWRARQERTRAGTPNAVTSSGMSRTTTAPAPMTLRAPIVIPDTIVAPAAMSVSSPIRTFAPIVAPTEM